MYRPATKIWLSFLALLGVAVSVTALYEHVIYRYGLALGPSFCNISQHINCEAVNASDWSVFFGLPVASYGIFFYISVFGLLLVSGANRRVSDLQATGVVFLASALGTIVSVALFLISEFVIGALCLLCMALYLVTFLLLVVSWWGLGCGFRAALIGGVQEALGFGRCVLRGERAALAGFVGLLLLGALIVISPVLTFEVAKGILKGAGGSLSEGDPVAAWRGAPRVDIPLSLNSGAFGDYSKGDPNALIQIVEFADFECPGCRVMYSALDQLLERFKGRYQLIFKNYPLDSACNPGITRSFHRNSCFAAYFARCAGEQGRFWEALEYLFTEPLLELSSGADRGEADSLDKQSSVDVRESLLEDGASELGLDPQGLRECVNSGRYLARVQEEVKQGDNLGLRSTPSFWVNGRKVEHPTPEVLNQIFSGILG
jgi:uncharacterized membrane protein/predicted DsbA family dithiol-disulfide isomerase